MTTDDPPMPLETLPPQPLDLIASKLKLTMCIQSQLNYKFITTNSITFLGNDFTFQHSSIHAVNQQDA